jgi:hypothetical protein
MPDMWGIDAIRARRIGGVGFALTWLVIAFTAAQFADLLTSFAVAHELNPVAKGVAASPMIGVAIKTALIAMVVATADILAPQRPTLARFVLVIGIVAGIVGALSNTSLSPFVAA